MQVKSPCVGICSSTSFGDEWCIGCGRHRDDVRDWNGMDISGKLNALIRAEENKMIKEAKRFMVVTNVDCSACDLNGADPCCEDCAGTGHYEIHTPVPDSTIAEILEHHKLVAAAKEYDASPPDAEWSENHPIFSMAAEIDRLRTQVVTAIGWTYADACVHLDQGKDYRRVEVPTILDRARRELGI